MATLEFKILKRSFEKLSSFKDFKKKIREYLQIVQKSQMDIDFFQQENLLLEEGSYYNAEKIYRYLNLCSKEQIYKEILKMKEKPSLLELETLVKCKFL